MQDVKYIIHLHLEFKRLRTYKEKVKFFDQHFGCFTGTYPAFDPELKFLFDEKEFELVTNLFEKERRKAIVLDRRYEVDGKLYIFNVTPINSNTVILSDYILDHFINKDEQFHSVTEELKQNAESQQKLMWNLRQDASKKIDSIESTLGGRDERGFRCRFMNVFIKGYRDEEQGLLKKFFTRKKFIELYVYAQGVLFRQYVQQLTDLCDFSASGNQVDLPVNKSVDISSYANISARI